MSKQQDLFLQIGYKKKSDRFGGEARTTRADRQFRPISTKTSMHLILKSLNATGSWSLLKKKNRRVVDHLIVHHARRNGVKIFRFVNAGNHLHIHLKVKSSTLYKRFVRSVSGAIALKITGANKTRRLTKKFWTHVPFTRFLHGLPDLAALDRYFDVNLIEAGGFGRQTAESFVEIIQSRRAEFLAASRMFK